MACMLVLYPLLLRAPISNLPPGFFDSGMQPSAISNSVEVRPYIEVHVIQVCTMLDFSRPLDFPTLVGLVSAGKCIFYGFLLSWRDECRTPWQ